MFGVYLRDDYILQHTQLWRNQLPVLALVNKGTTSVGARCAMQTVQGARLLCIC